MRTTPRPRHPIHPVAFLLLRPALRFSYTREAYVLRLIGNQRGPVFVRRRPAGHPAASTESTDGRPTIAHADAPPEPEPAATPRPADARRGDGPIGG